MTLNKISSVFAVALSAVAISACTSPTLDKDFGVRPGSGYGTTGESDTTLVDPWEKEKGLNERFDNLNEKGAFQPLPADQQIFKPVYFARNRYVIGSTETAKLDSLANYLQANGNVHLAIEGHCSIRGSEEYNIALSEKRALAALNYLVARGVPPSRIDTVSYGEGRPAVEGNNEAAHRANRRSAFVLGYKK